MHYLDLFTYLDPLTGELPACHGQHAAEAIVSRARNVLRAYDASEVLEIAEDAQWMVREYFSTKEELVVAQILSDGLGEQLLTTGSDGQPVPLDSAHDRYDLRGQDEMSTVEALSEALDCFFDPVGSPVKNGTRHPYLAVLTLLAINECARRTQAGLEAAKWHPASGWVEQASADKSRCEVWMGIAVEALDFAQTLEKDEHAKWAHEPVRTTRVLLSAQDHAELAQLRGLKAARSKANSTSAAGRHARNREGALAWMRKHWPGEHSRHDNLDSALEDFSVLLREERKISLTAKTLKPLLRQVIKETGLEFKKREKTAPRTA